MDTPDDVVFDNLQAAAYANQSLGRSILGEADNIKAFRQEDLLEYLADKYVASNIVISAVGNLKHSDLVTMIEDKLGELLTGTPAKMDTAAYVGGRKIESRELEQVHITAAWPGFSFHDDNYYAMQVYSTILGGGMSSRLFQEVREHRGLAYSVYSFTSSHAETGMFGLYAGTSPDMVAEMVPVISAEMAALAKGPEAIEYKVAIAQLKASLMMALEATTSRMEQLGRQMLVFDRVIPVEEMIANVGAVELCHVQRVAEQLCNVKDPTIAIVGPGDYQKLTF
ncbi:MAG: insulinase family protein [Kordiimonadaceae bacterium]|nr:insulinase family protein [Kordiimonadaceae bacterium]